MINQVILVGNLGADPEVRESKNGMKIANFRMATTHRAKRGDEWKAQTEWHNVVSFGKTAEFIANYMGKGSKAYVQGRIQTRQWEDRDGNTRYTVEIVAETFKSLSSPAERKTNGAAQENTFDMDEVPF